MSPRAQTTDLVQIGRAPDGGQAEARHLHVGILPDKECQRMMEIVGAGVDVDEIVVLRCINGSEQPLNLVVVGKGEVQRGEKARSLFSCQPDGRRDRAQRA